MVHHGGNIGSPSTRLANAMAARECIEVGNALYGEGAVRELPGTQAGKREHHIPGPNPGTTKGSSYVDVTLQAHIENVVRYVFINVSSRLRSNPGQMTADEQRRYDNLEKNRTARRPNAFLDDVRKITPDIATDKIAREAYRRYLHDECVRVFSMVDAALAGDGIRLRPQRN